jgi:hypothetical protein
MQTKRLNVTGVSDDPRIYLYVGAGFRKSGRSYCAHFFRNVLILRGTFFGTQKHWPRALQKVMANRRTKGFKKSATNVSANYSRIPWSVLSDKMLKHLDVRIYGVLAAYERHGGMVRTGERLLAESVGFSRRYFRQLVQRLAARKHVEIISAGVGSRRAYRLTDPLFMRAEAAKRPAGLFCGCCQKQMRGAICEECHGRQQLADAV